MILCINNKYYLSTDEYYEESVIDIQGNVTSINSYNWYYIVITTDINTYYLSDNRSQPVALNIICKNVIITRDSILLFTESDDVKMLSFDGILYEDRIIANKRFCPPNRLIDSVNYSYLLSTIPTDIYFCYMIKKKILLINDNFFIYQNKEKVDPILIEKNFTIAKIFVDKLTNTSYHEHNIFVLDTEQNIWTLEVVSENIKFVRLIHIDNSIDIREIFTFGSHLYVIGKDFINLYRKNVDIIFYQHELIDKYISMSYQNQNQNQDQYQDQFKLVTNLWDGIVIISFNYENKYVVIPNNIDHFILKIKIPHIYYTVLGNFVLIGSNKNTKLVYSKKYFYVLTKEILRQDNMSVINLITKTKPKEPVYINRSLCSTMEIYVDNKLNFFDSIFNTLIATNFNYKLLLNLKNMSKLSAYGSGADRTAYSYLFDVMKSDLFQLDESAIFPNSYNLNLNNPFYIHPNNSFYLGKMIMHISKKYQMNFYLTLESIIVIYQKLCQIKNKSNTTFNINELAPFHFTYNPSEFNTIVNMDVTYMLNDNKFKELSLPYENFEHMILSIMKIKSKLSYSFQLQPEMIFHLEQIALGMYNYNETIVYLNMYELCSIISVPYIYDKQKIISNIHYHFINVPKELDTLNITNEHCIKVKNFINNLNDDEFKKFMINVSGNIIRNNIDIYIDYGSNKFDIKITTCDDLVFISNRVLGHENYDEILKAYLCTKDFDICDLHHRRNRE
jgi:hypothetical protein